MAFNWSSLNPFTAIANVVKEPINEWQKRKTAESTAKAEIKKIEADTDKALALGKLEMAKTGQAIQANWDDNAQKAAERSKMDEVWDLVFMAPLITIFLCAMWFPEKMASFDKAVEAVEKLPLEYWIALGGILAYRYGLRWMMEPLMQGLKVKIMGKFRPEPPQVRTEYVYNKPEIKIDQKPEDKKLCVICEKNEPDFDGVTCSDCNH